MNEIISAWAMHDKTQEGFYFEPFASLAYNYMAHGLFWDYKIHHLIAVPPLYRCRQGITVHQTKSFGSENHATSIYLTRTKRQQPEHRF